MEVKNELEGFELLRICDDIIEIKKSIGYITLAIEEVRSALNEQEKINKILMEEIVKRCGKLEVG